MPWEANNFTYEKQELGLLKLHRYFSTKYVLIIIPLLVRQIQKCPLFRGNDMDEINVKLLNIN